MGRPIQKQVYLGTVGSTTNPVPHQIQAEVYAATDSGYNAGYLVSQNSPHRFRAYNATTSNSSICTLVNGTGNLVAGTASVKVFPVGSDPTTYATATANLLALSNANVVMGGTGYHVGDTLALVGGTGTATHVTVTANSTGGIITGLSTPTVAGSYSVLPSNIANISTSNVTGNGTGATVSFNFGINAVNITNGGAGYGADVVLVFPQANVAPTATGTATLGVVNNTISVAAPGVVNVSNPTIVVESSSGTTEYVQAIQSRDKLVTYQGNVYTWLAKGQVPPSDYATLGVKLAYLDTL